MTLYTRRDWGAQPATAGPGLLDPAEVEGIALHWPGMKTPRRGFEAVALALRAWQRYHMSKGWSDIAYQEAVDQDGHVYMLRGLTVQSGANGDTDPNERFGALLLVLAPDEEPTPAMLETARWRIAQHRNAFPRSDRVVGHADIRPEPTACPGPITMRLIRAGAFEEDDMPTVDDFWSKPVKVKGEDEYLTAAAMLSQIHARTNVKRVAAALARQLDGSEVTVEQIEDALRAVFGSLDE